MRRTTHVLPASMAAIIVGLVLSLALIGCAQSDLADRIAENVISCESGRSYGPCGVGGTLYCNAAGELQCIGGSGTSTSTGTSTGTGLAPNNSEGTRMTVLPGRTTINVTPGLEKLPQPVSSATVTQGGYTFSQDWACRPDPANPSLFCFNPSRESIPGQTFVSPMAPIFYDNGPDQSVASPFLGWVNISTQGLCFSMQGRTPGIYHVNMVSQPVSTTERPEAQSYWLQFGEAGKNPALLASQYIEQGKNQDGSWRNSLGCVFNWTGSSYAVAPTGGNALR